MSYSPTTMTRLSRLTNEFLNKMENHATTEGSRLHKPLPVKLRLIAYAIGIVVVILLAIWMAYH